LSARIIDGIAGGEAAKAQVDGAVQGVAGRMGPSWAPEFRNINVLTSEKLSDLGNSATFYSVLVEVESAKSLP